MGRPLSIEYPGALYHVTFRGNEQSPSFSSVQWEAIGQIRKLFWGDQPSRVSQNTRRFDGILKRDTKLSGKALQVKKY
jgi:hypothetical protein